MQAVSKHLKIRRAQILRQEARALSHRPDETNAMHAVAILNQAAKWLEED